MIGPPARRSRATSGKRARAADAASPNTIPRARIARRPATSVTSSAEQPGHDGAADPLAGQVVARHGVWPPEERSGQHQRAGGVEVERSAHPGGRDHRAADGRAHRAGKVHRDGVERNCGGKLSLRHDLAHARLPGRAGQGRPRRRSEKVNSRRVAGVTRPRPLRPGQADRHQAPSRAAPGAAPDRRSQRSASVPASSANSRTGSVGRGLHHGHQIRESRRAWSSAMPHPPPGLWCPSH